jgi:hypothetical protein
LLATKLNGVTPKAVMFFVNGRYDGSEGGKPDGLSCIGVATGASNRYAQSLAGEDNAGTTNTSFKASSSRCIYQADPDGTIVAEADFNCFVTNGARITWKANPGQDYRVTVVFFAGSKVSAYAGELNPNDTEDGTVATTDPGFKPDMVFGFLATSAYNTKC